jgi:outer membrane biogenesis lipoprotein LolB
MNVRNERNDEPKLTSRSSRFPHLLISMALLVGCHSSSEKKQEKLSQERASWQATAQLTHELSQSGAVPKVYRRQVMEKSSDNLQKIRRQEQQLSQ